MRYGNFFSHESYLTALADVYFPGEPHAIEIYRTEGRLFRLLRVRGKVIISWAFLDFFQQLDAVPDGAEVRTLSYLPNVALATNCAAGMRQPAGPGALKASPFIDWSLFPDWASFERMVKSRIGNLFPDSRRRRKKVERDLGLLRFVFNDPRPEPFEACMRWKSAQWRSSGHIDSFAIEPRHVCMFRELQCRGLLAVSSLSAGERLLSVHIGGIVDNRLYWWVPAYDPELARYSPGRLLLEDLLIESFSRGHAEFDFLIGDEAYKWYYATHNRDIGPLGRPSLTAFLRHGVKPRIRRALAHTPRVLQAALALRRRATELRNVMAGQGDPAALVRRNRLASSRNQHSQPDA
jgi:Acetyltransferase (GNAT) domain